MIKLVMYDARNDSRTKGRINEIFLGEHKPLLVRIPKTSGMAGKAWLKPSR